VTITASGIAFTTAEVAAPAGVGFTLRFDNQDAGIPHDVQIKDQAGQVVFKTDIITGVLADEYAVPALDPGDHPFICSVHPNMTGTLNAE
jgi:plastocyanin